MKLRKAKTAFPQNTKTRREIETRNLKKMTKDKTGATFTSKWKRIMSMAEQSRAKRGASKPRSDD